MKLWWSLLLVLGVVLSIMSITAQAESDVWEEDDEREVLVRTVRGTKDRASGSNGPVCRYSKGEWSECDPKTNMRSRSLSLKKGDKTCEQTKNIQKKCKKGKACRYDKGTFSACVNMSMTRVDNLKPNSDSSCDQTRRITKSCKPEAASSKKVTKADRNRKTGKQ
ncbi:uncharacterized protein LOC130673786 [Microplitis mediator]|uniref:uncharacterized protein LOC130673786 n=1 Tax=Microplitis mediator TaxID=375433 RepID=UPI0025554941|nr:uncharacterized protein LOC130673786 [Microplitis mediator]XP_057334979.1 uncharacterized protein LOC130673786 [Microplitis mediator]XP_057334980.1 uncharacterized protein LOC130673786 [Microplitis mediator]